MIGIIVAMDKELALLRPVVSNPIKSTVEGLDVLTGKIGTSDVVIAKCGIGKVNAALGTDTVIRHFKPSIVINTGVAGGTGRGARILDVVVASGIAYHDVWCGPGTEPGQAAGCPRIFTPLPQLLALPALSEVRHGLIASGDIFVSHEDDLRRILHLWPDAIAVDMESAAMAQTCHRHGVPFLCLRVISDTPGAADNISQYENFWTDAPLETFRILTSVIDQLAR